MDDNAQTPVGQARATVLATKALSRAALSSRRELAGHDTSEEELRTALQFLETQIRGEMRRNPNAWQFGEWKVSFVNDSRYGCPPIVKQLARGQA